MGPDSHSTPDMEAAGQGAHDPQSEFRVTTEYDEHSEDNIFDGREDNGMPSTAEAERIREEDLICSDSEDDSLVDDEDEDEDEDDDTPPADSFSRRLHAQRRTESLGRHRQGPSLVHPTPPSGSHGNASRTEVLKPHARFFIEREKSMVSIKFHPPPYVALYKFHLFMLMMVLVRDVLFLSSFGVLAVMATLIFRVSLPMDMRDRDSFLVPDSDELMVP